jgi:ABC-type lipoprotein export system ATPase subunit
MDSDSAKKITDFFVDRREPGKTILISTHVENLAKLANKSM